MYKYICRRLFMIVPTLFGVTLVCFAIINLAPGSPVEQKIRQLKFGGMGEAGGGGGNTENAITEEVIMALKKQYGFDRPVHIRYFIWLKNLVSLDFGESFSYEEPVLDVIISKFPVSMQFGVISFFLTYLICIPLGVLKAIRHGTPFDFGSSFILFIMYSIPGFMLAVLLIVFFSGGNFLDWFPIGGLYSDGYEEMGFFEKIKDRIHHAFMPLICYMIGHFTMLTMLMKNSILNEVKKDYIRTARAKGLGERRVYLKHALRNALIPITTGIGEFLTIFFAGSFLLETVFQLDGMGLLGFQSVLERDYNVIMGLIFIQSALMLLGNLISDIAYTCVDPRIDFS